MRADLFDTRTLRVTEKLPATVETGDFALSFAELSLLFEIVPLVAVALAFTEADLDFYPAAFKIKLQADDGESLLLGGFLQFKDLLAMEKNFARALGSVLEELPCRLPGLNVTTVEPSLITLDADEGVTNVDLAFANGFDLGPNKNDTCFKGVADEIIPAGFFIRRNLAIGRSRLFRLGFFLSHNGGGSLDLLLLELDLTLNDFHESNISKAGAGKSVYQRSAARVELLYPL